jgi:alkanesulfonate monooxygenase SsuD/methylene tetrahydromethanopterin reductase-like flavin-dependent oxidoreductase (luciferase family)
MQVSVQLKPEDSAIFLESAKLADRSGFSTLYMVDGQLLWRDIYVYMTLALEATERMVVASAMTNPVTRHFTVTANAHATLAELYPGRVMLGIGRGDNAVRTLGLHPAPTSELEEAVRQIRALVDGEETQFRGHTIRSAWEPREQVPILMPGTGPRNLRLAGALADKVMIQVGANPASCRWAVDNIRRGAEEAGRDPASVSIVAHCVVNVTDDLPKAREDARWIVELVAIHAADVMHYAKDHGMPEPLTRLGSMVRKDYAYTSHLSKSADRPYYTDEIIDDVAILGGPDTVVRRLEDLAEAGLDEVAPAYLNGDFENIRRIGEEIIPRVAGVKARL